MSSPATTESSENLLPTLSSSPTLPENVEQHQAEEDTSHRNNNSNDGMANSPNSDNGTNKDNSSIESEKNGEGNEELPTNATAQNELPTNSTVEKKETVMDGRALNRRLKIEQERKKRIALRHAPPPPPKENITQIYPKELHNSWCKTGSAEMQGKRPVMEDASTIIMSFVTHDLQKLSQNYNFEQNFLLKHLKDENTSTVEDIFVGVYDGHGGSSASTFVGQELHKIFLQKLSLYEKYKKQICPSIYSHTTSTASQSSSSLIAMNPTTITTTTTTPTTTTTTTSSSSTNDNLSEDAIIYQRQILNRLPTMLNIPLYQFDEEVMAVQNNAKPSSPCANTNLVNDDNNDKQQTSSDSAMEIDDNDNKEENDDDDDNNDDEYSEEEFDDDDDGAYDMKATSKLLKEPSAKPLDLMSFSEQDVIMLLMRESFIEVHEVMNEKKVPHGTTASAVYIQPHTKRCYIANVGDSRVVAYRKQKPIRLTPDHRPGDKDEESRIKDCGGSISNGRVNGMLAITRALGDHFLCSSGVTPDPSTSCFELTEEDEFLIIACDGVWDFMAEEDACRIAKEEKDPRIASYKIRDYAYEKRGSSDNISVVVIRFSTPEPSQLVSIGPDSANNTNNEDSIMTEA